MSVCVAALPKSQSQLLLYQARQPYEIARLRDLPDITHGEVLVQVLAIGLNPVDWKSAAYGFALPAFPCVNGREFVGRVVRSHPSPSPDLKVGDIILSIATDYRDFRKSGFQEYAVVTNFNAVKLPQELYAPRAAAVGVAYVAATMSLGVCLGLMLSHNVNFQLDLLNLARAQGRKNMPGDILEEVFDAFDALSRPVAGDWILIYGASTITGQVAIQIAKWSGLRVIAVVNRARHCGLLQSLGADLIIDRENLDQAAADIHAVVAAPIKFAFDTVGSESAAWCQNLLSTHTQTKIRESSQSITDEPTNSQNSSEPLAHLVCLVGRPKESNPSVRIHQVPIKLFHTHQDIGNVLSNWLTALLANGKLKLPETVFEDGGLEAIGPALEKIRRGELSGKRLVIRIDGN